MAAKIHIRGLVKIMRQVRERLRQGISPADAPAFRRLVRETTAQVEAICRTHHLKLDDLPAPSYRAYQFLKTLDLEDLPVRGGDTPPPSSLRISGLLAMCEDFQTRLAELAEAVSLNLESPDVQALLDDLQHKAAKVEMLCQEQGGTPGHLPIRSRRAYQWLKFLTDPVHLLAHLKTLSQALLLVQSPAFQKRLPKARRKLPIHLTFFYGSTLYRTRVEPDGLLMVAHEGFVGAPGDVVRDLAWAGLSGIADDSRWRVRHYATTERFMTVSRALEGSGTRPEEVSQGRYFDLDVVFERVNMAYFDGKLERPQLTWSCSLTRRKFGHYHCQTDTVMVSMTLDDPAVPAYVVDFVMYHELLHKAIGVTVSNGRRRAHTRAFRSAERNFARYEEAKDFLRTLG